MSKENVLAFPAPAPLTVPPASADFSRPIAAGLTVIALAFGGLGTWAALAPIDSAVVAPGVLVVESNRKTVQHLEGGIVKEILVRDGDSVTAGQVLVRLDDTQAVANLAMVRDRLIADRATEARLVAERDGADRLSFPPDLANAADVRVHDILAGQLSQFEERRRSQDGQVAILEQRIAQLTTQADGFRRQQDSKLRQIELYNNELTGLYELHRKGYYPRTRILAMERDLARLEGEVGSVAADIARAEEGIGEARIQIMQLRQKFREDVVAQLRDIQTEINELTERVVAAEDVVRRLTVVAPVAGAVQGLKVFTAGGVIPPGADLMEIVPEDRLVIETHVAPADVETVSYGLDAEVRFPALNKRTTPIIAGHVLTVSADRFTDQRTNLAYYTARVEVPPDQQALLSEHRLQPGMPAEVIVKTGERTLLEYLVKPLTDGFARTFKEQ